MTAVASSRKARALELFAGIPGEYDVWRCLGPSIASFAEHLPPTRLAALWRDAGIGGVVVHPLSFGSGIVMWGTRDGGSG